MAKTTNTFGPEDRERAVRMNRGAYFTVRWLDEHISKRADLRKGFDDFSATPEGRMDAQ